LYVIIKKLKIKNWQPVPREFSTLTEVNKRAFLMGGLSSEASKEVA